MMRTCILTATLLALTTMAGAQTTTFDFEGITSLADLEAQGWVLYDEQPIVIDPDTTPPTTITYPGTITIETEIVHSGSQALRMGYRDLAYYPLNGKFGTLELWVFDEGWPVHEWGMSSAYGPTFGFRKFGTNGYAYGAGAGLVHKTFLSCENSYGYEAGQTENAIVAMLDQGMDTTGVVNAGWAGDQSWWGPRYLGYLPNGRPEIGVGGWNKWRIAYLAPGQVEITLVESWAGDTRSPAEIVPANAFDGSVAGGLDDIFLYGGRSADPSGAPLTVFGDGIFDDLVWTPLDDGGCDLPGDADCDGDVDLDDFVILKVNFGTGDEWAEGDFDGDADVDLDDFVILKTNFGASSN